MSIVRRPADLTDQVADALRARRAEAGTAFGAAKAAAEAASQLSARALAESLPQVNGLQGDPVAFENPGVAFEVSASDAERGRGFALIMAEVDLRRNNGGGTAGICGADVEIRQGDVGGPRVHSTGYGSTLPATRLIPAIFETRVTRYPIVAGFLEPGVYFAVMTYVCQGLDTLDVRNARFQVQV